MKKTRMLISVFVILLVISGCSSIPQFLPSGDLTGTVTNKVDSMPIIGALVEIKDSSYTAQTNSNGNFTFKDLTPGSYTVIVTKEGYENTTEIVSVRADDITSVSIKLQPIASQVSKGNLSGEVFYKNTQNPIEDVTITIDGTNFVTTTDLMGEFSFNDLEYGTYTLIASKPDYVLAQIDVTIDSETQTVIVELVNELNAAELLVSDFKTSMYRMGTIYTEESSIVQGHFEDEMIPFFEEIGPYMIDVENGLYHLDVTWEDPGEYNSYYNEWDYLDYELIEKGDPNADNWTWIVHDDENGITVTISTPNNDQMATLNEDETEMTVDLTNATFEYSIVSEEHPDTIYAATLNIGNENVKTFTVYFEDEVYDEESGEYIETTYTYHYIIPTGPTAEINCEIDLNSEDEIDEIMIEATFDVPSLSDNLELVLDGTLTTPVFTFEGTLNFEMEIPNDEFFVDEPNPFTIFCNGLLSTEEYTVNGNILAAFEFIEIIEEYYGETYVNIEIVPSYIEINGAYESDTTYFKGMLSYKCTDLNSWIDSNFPDGVFTVSGSLNHINVDQYDLNVTIIPTEYNVLIEFDFSKDYFSLKGKVSYDDMDGITYINFEDHRGTTFDVAITNSEEEFIGTITDSENNVCAQVKLVDNMDALMIIYSDSGNYEYIPLNPLEYLPGL
ncbi:MAG: DUF2012 domain-containing protein [Halanaerobiales bacterium]|nr:DUF2012 domain-containing protein [Halanaerobiales bacterium]